MKRIRTAREFYCELLKSFYLGTYRKGDSLMTYQETHETYGLSKDTIGRTYAMLRRDGFIHTDGAKGTIVTFDLNNPAHVGKVPLEWPSAKPEDTIPYEVAMRLHAQSLYMGLTQSNEAQLQACKEIIEDILMRVNNGTAYYEQVGVCVLDMRHFIFRQQLYEPHYWSFYQLVSLPAASDASFPRAALSDWR